jgi:hypothetical protein
MRRCSASRRNSRLSRPIAIGTQFTTHAWHEIRVVATCIVSLSLAHVGLPGTGDLYLDIQIATHGNRSSVVRNGRIFSGAA